MIDLDEKQIAIKLSEKYISRLDDLAKRGNTNRRQLMVNFIRIWLEELRESNSANFFHLAIILREIQADMEMDSNRRSEFVESFFPSPERPLPIMLSEDDSYYTVSAAGRCNMTRHNFMKNMVITGIEELEILTSNQEYEYYVVEPKLKRAFGIIVAKGLTAFRKGIKEKSPLKRIKYE
ncbi:MAG: hypothetical protein NT047_02520 [Deltaproteobacteria bacterium]|nr:hypothetical protein [Deltaproteobacteria bacterium]